MAAPNAWNVILGAPTFSDAGVVTASGSRSGFPVTNLQVQDPSDRYEVVASRERISIHVDSGAKRAFNGVFLGYTNLTQYASWRIRYADTLAEVTSNPHYDSAPLGPSLRLYTSTSTSRTFAASWGAIVDFSIECWFRIESDLTSVGIMARGLASDDPGIWVNSTRHIVFGDFTNPSEQVTSTTQVEAGVWYHVCGAYSSSGTEMAIIVNGVEEATAVAPGSWSSANHIRVGIPRSERMNGLIQAPRFWQKRRSASEVAADYETLLIGTETDLVAAWQNADGTGDWNEIVSAGVSQLIATDCDWAYDVQAWSVDDYPDFMERHCLHLEIPVGASARYLRIDVCDGQNPDGVLRFGRLNVGGWIQPLQNAQYGTDLIQWEDTGTFDRTVNGASIVVPASMKRRADFRFATTEAADVSLLNELFAARGGTYDVVFCMDPSRTDSYTHQGLFSGVLGLRSAIRPDGYGLWRSTWSVTEL